ncbi:MAG: hydroxysqualene dehydroxylase HpnE [Bryobacteraceae bacterium]|jgi:zeta-carotene desaturase
MSDVLILGGGLAGLAAAAALGESGFDVTVLETKPFAGGRATSYPAPATEDEEAATIDNCQHILLRCCVNLLAFYRRLGVAGRITFHRDFFFIEPGGRTSVLKAGLLPAPLHFTGSFATLRFLSLADKFAIARALLALRSERRTRRDLDAITMLDWLREKRQTPAAIRRFWQQVLVSAINEDLDRMSAAHGFQVFWLGFLGASDSYEMGLPNVPLGELYGAAAWQRLPHVRLSFRTPVTQVRLADGIVEGVEAGGTLMAARHYISALPFERVAALESLAPALGVDFTQFEHVPITGIHLWFDRPVTELPYGTLLDRTMQWFFNKDGGRYLQLVVSASRALTPMSRGAIIDLSLRELAEFLPAVRGAKLVRAHVVKEVRATFSARPGLEQFRPAAATSIPNLTLAGDWTRSGWPSTMEGAVRSGHIAAERASAVLGRPGRYLLPDIA